MFPGRLSEATADEVRAVIETEVAEGDDLELKRELPFKRGQTEDPWMVGGEKVGENARDELAKEINAFANTIGGTLIVGIDENRETKTARGPILPIPRCKVAAERLHQAIGDRIEPKLPVFECEGVITEEDGSSGVIIMRTFESYLAPHRHTQDNHCYTRRNDRAEPMSMLEIQELTRRKARSAEEAEKAFGRSSERFYSWIPESSRRTHPHRSVQGRFEEVSTENKGWVGLWAMRLTARPLSPVPIADVPRQAWLAPIPVGSFTGPGKQRSITWQDLQVTRTWRARLRAVEREFQGAQSRGVDRITSDGLIERFVRLEDRESGQRPRHLMADVTQFVWNVASVLQLAGIVRAAASRPSQQYALEIEWMPSDPFLLHGYSGEMPHCLLPNEPVLFPRYEVGPEEGFNELLTTFDRDVWNLGGVHPNWELEVNWPPVTVSSVRK